MTIFAASKKKKNMPASKTKLCYSLSELLSEYDGLQAKNKPVVAEGNRLKVNGRTVVELVGMESYSLPQDRLGRMIPQETFDWLTEKGATESITAGDVVVKLVEAEKARDAKSRIVRITNRKSLSDYLVNARKSAGLTVEKVADLSGLNQAAVRVVEKCQANFSSVAALQYLACFNLAFALVKDDEITIVFKSNGDILDWISVNLPEKDSVNKFANAVGNSDTAIYIMLNKRSKVSIEMLISAAQYFGYEVCLTEA